MAEGEAWLRGLLKRTPQTEAAPIPKSVWDEVVEMGRLPSRCRRCGKAMQEQEQLICDVGEPYWEVQLLCVECCG